MHENARRDQAGLGAGPEQPHAVGIQLPLKNVDAILDIMPDSRLSSEQLQHQITEALQHFDIARVLRRYGRGEKGGCGAL